MHDLLILGGGPAGYHAAEQAAARGLTCVLFEERALGGVCLNEGCIPSKTFLHSAKLHEICNGAAAKFGVASSGATLDHAAVLARKNKLVRQLTAAVSALLRNAGVETTFAHAVIQEKTSTGFIVSAGDRRFEGRNLLIATGSHAALPPIPGLAEAFQSGFAVTNREILSLDRIPESLLALGGGIIGLEMASYFREAGSAVVIAEALPRIAPTFDAELSELLRKNMEKRGIRILTDSRCVEIREREARIRRPDGSIESISAEKILVATGRKPNVEGFGLERTGVVLTPNGAIPSDDRMRTGVPGLYVAGDANGRSMLAHTAFREAEIAVSDMAGESVRMDYSAIPSVLYGHPEAASVGLTLAEAKEKGLNARETKLSMRFSGRYLVENEGGNGVMKLTLDSDGVIIGASLIGDPASEIIASAALAVQNRMTCRAFAETVFPHPTVSEIFRDAALAAMRSSEINR